MGARETLEVWKKDLENELSAIISQLNQTLDDVHRMRLGRQADAKLQEIKKVQKDIDALPMVNIANVNQARQLSSVEFNSKLPYMDFEQLENTLNQILNKHQQGGCASLILLQQGTQMGGKYGAARIREILQKKTSQGLFRAIRLRFDPTDRAEQITLLQRLGGHFNVIPDSEEIPRSTRQLAETLCGSMRMGSVILVECGRCEYWLDKPQIVTWLVEEFWAILVNQLEIVASQHAAVKLIFLLMVDGDLKKDLIPDDLHCDENTYQKYKLLEIPLNKWSQEDIKNWIASYSGLPYDTEELQNMTNKIYNATGGLPGWIAQALEDHCCPVAEN